jgi:sporulation protein YlmC with PRC-barrel domain
VLSLSEVIGLGVRGPEGHEVGRIADVTARLGTHDGNAVGHRILVRRRRNQDQLVPWSAVTAIAHDGATVTADGSVSAITSVDAAMETDEILLGRDVLDTQILDTAGQRLTRVADVILSPRTDGRLELVGVDVGFGTVLRRLGFGKLVSQWRTDLVTWTDLHLTSKRGHTVQLKAPRAAIHLLDADELAALIDRLDTESATEVLAAREPEIAAAVIYQSTPAVGERLLRAMSEAHAANVVAAMPVHHALHWNQVLAAPQLLRGRHFLRSRAWPRRAHRADRR